MRGALYNEIESYPAEWIRNLIAGGHVAPGDVDERSIVEIRPAELAGRAQCHFFAGIAVWSYALRLAGWGDDREVWTGSCPCQPFSAAGRRGGFDDDRHLWPVWFGLIRECRPAVVLGEQVASPDGLRWLDAVSSDLEDAGYAVGAADLCAAGVGAPHIRQRLYFVAHTGGQRRDRIGVRVRGRGPREASVETDGCGEDNGMAYSDVAGPQGRIGGRDGASEWAARPGGVVDADRERCERAPCPRRETRRWTEYRGDVVAWDDLEWLDCSDGKRRPTQPGLRPLVAGPAARVVDGGAVESQPIAKQLKGYGNGLVAQQAATFIRAVMEVLA